MTVPQSAGGQSSALRGRPHGRCRVITEYGAETTTGYPYGPAPSVVD